MENPASARPVGRNATSAVSFAAVLHYQRSVNDLRAALTYVRRDR